MGCQSRYADANDFAAKFCTSFAEEDESEINRMLELAASNINMAIYAASACDCAFSSYTTQYLIDLNCVIALVTYNCQCDTVRALSAGDRATWADWANGQLELIRTGKIELCAGETSTDFPYTGWAEQGWTEANEGQIIVNDILRNS